MSASPLRTRRLVRPAAATLVLAALVVVSCGRTGEQDQSLAADAPASSPASAGFAGRALDQVQQQANAVPAPPPAPASTPVDGEARRMAKEATSSLSLGAAQGSGAGGNVAPPLAAIQDPRVDAMLIRTGNTSIEVDSLDAAVARVRQLATSLGGFVAGSSTQTGTGEVRSATLELRIPSARFDDALTGLRPLGEVELVNVQAQDVGEEYVDVTARIATGRRLEERLVRLLETRTGRLDDVLAVERELARVRGEIERFEGRLRWLRERVSMSTLQVHLHEPFPVIGPSAGHGPIAEAFRQAWRNLVALTAAGIASLGFVGPLAALGAVIWMLVRRWRRRAPVATMEA